MEWVQVAKEHCVYACIYKRLANVKHYFWPGARLTNQGLEEALPSLEPPTWILGFIRRQFEQEDAEVTETIKLTVV
jgi:hypothetical protein